MKAGATDYLVKASLSPESLFKSIRHAINLFKEEQKRIQAEESLKAQGLLFSRVFGLNSSSTIYKYNNTSRVDTEDDIFRGSRTEGRSQTIVNVNES